jgi:hypothetical protein
LGDQSKWGVACFSKVKQFKAKKLVDVAISNLHPSRRLFPTVEMRARKLEKYESLPEQQEFVEAVLVEIGFKQSGK